MMTDIKVVVPSDINTTAGGLKFEDKMWGVDVDNDTIKLKGNTLYAVEQGGVEFANPDEIDAGASAPRDKAVSAYEYQKDVRCNYKKQYNVELGLVASVHKSLTYSTCLGNWAGDRATGYGNVFVGYAGEGSNGEYNISIGFQAGDGSQSTRSLFLGYYGKNRELDKKTLGQTNVNLIGSAANPRDQESNYFQLGNTDTQNIYTSATYNGKGFNKTSDMRSKRVIQRLSTLDNGISVYLFQYLDNGMTSVGWIAQEVEELLRDKGYDEQIIEIAIPRSHDVDWQATIGKFQNEIGSVVKSWTDAQALYNRLVAQYLTENGITESYEEFMRNMEIYFEDKEKNPPAEVTPENAKREEIYANLKAKDLNNYLTYADDIRYINESVVNKLL